MLHRSPFVDVADVHRQTHAVVPVIPPKTLLSAIRSIGMRIPSPPFLSCRSRHRAESIAPALDLESCSPLPTVFRPRGRHEVDAAPQRAGAEVERIGSLEHLDVLGRHRVEHTDDIRPIGEVHRNPILQQIYAPSLRIALYARSTNVESRLIVQSEKLLNDHARLHPQGLLERRESPNVGPHLHQRRTTGDSPQFARSLRRRRRCEPQLSIHLHLAQEDGPCLPCRAIRCHSSSHDQRVGPLRLRADRHTHCQQRQTLQSVAFSFWGARRKKRHHLSYNWSPKLQFPPISYQSQMRP